MNEHPYDQVCIFRVTIINLNYIHMKKIILMLCFVGFSALAQEKQATSSKLEEVTVYLKGAQITRSFDAVLKKGKNQLVVLKLPARIRETSIQVSTRSKGVKVLAVNSKLNYLEEQQKSDEIKRLEMFLQEEKDQLSKASSLLQVYMEEESMLKQNKTVGGQENGLNVEDLKLLADYLRERLTGIAMKKLELQKDLEEHNRQIGIYHAQLQTLNNKTVQPQREITVLVDAANSINGSFMLDYTVDEAGWIPSYDIRADQVDQPIRITYKAGVYQNTGEDWTDVRLTFSNADPSISGQAPYLQPWYLDFNNKYSQQQIILNDRITGRVVGEDGEGLPGVNVVIKGTTVGTVTNVDGYYELPLTPGASSIIYSFIGFGSKELQIGRRSVINVAMQEDVAQLSEVVVTGYGARRAAKSESAPMMMYDAEYLMEEKVNIAATAVIRQTTFEFKVDDPYTVKSTGQHELIDLMEYKVESNFVYYSAPKMATPAFLTARLLDWESLNFLSGEASLFFEGKFIGKTVLDTQAAKDTLSLSLGTDKGISIEREKLKNYTSKSFIGGNRKELNAFKITVKNNKSVAVDITVEDQVPVSTHEDISVEVLEFSKAEYNEETGKLKWQLKLQPGEHRELEFKYEVKYPKDKYIALE